jgi:hypothetical protein
MGGSASCTQKKAVPKTVAALKYEELMTSIPKDILSTIRLIKFKDLKSLKTFPRNPESRELTLPLEEMTIERYNKSLVIFVSHCWLRSREGSEGWDGKPHPDTVDGEKYRLCVNGIDQILCTLAPGMEDCYLWLDYGCIDQDNGDPAEQLKYLDKIMQVCDCIFTPIYDGHHKDWNFPSNEDNIFDAYKSQAWNGHPLSYMNRSWCRIEMFYAANIPILEDNDERKNRMTAELRAHREKGKRPHIIYGTKDFAALRLPQVLPPLPNAYFDLYHPEKGHLTNETDITVITRLVNELKPYLKEIKSGYEGEYKYHWKMHGKGIYRHSNGDIYEGEWKDGRKHGKGIYRAANGNVYEGDWKDDKENGKGIYRFTSGNVFQGEWKDGKMKGKGVARYADGDVYEGEWEKDKRNGMGIYRSGNGDVYKGEWKESKMHGKGLLRCADGNSYEGDFKENKIHGRGVYHYANGNVYEGGFKDGEKSGRGKYLYANGDIFDGEYLDDQKHGKGSLRYADGSVFEGEWEDDKKRV